MSDPNEPLVRRFDVKRISGHGSERIIDVIAAEEPLSIHISYSLKDALRTESLALTMRTPGNDHELAAGVLLSEGIVRTREDIAEVRNLGPDPCNEVMVALAPAVDVETWRLSRNTFVSASCGVCGKRSRDALAQQIPQRSADRFQMAAAVIDQLPDKLREWQSGFAQTGGLHAAALVNSAGEIEQVFEDIGRHNALDKLLGWALLNGRIPLSNSVLFLSSRSSFELVQKAALAGAPVLATVGGPSSLAIEAAREFGITLLGFVRGGRVNVYSGDWRIHCE